MENIKNLSNLLSLSRIALIPFIIVLSAISTPTSVLLSGVLFLLASVTDYLDGYLARKYGISSKVGSLLDLLGDKLLVSSCMIWLSYSFNNQIILVITLIIVSREITVSVLRQFLDSNDSLEPLKVNFLGKTKTFFQMVSIFFLILVDEFTS
jgi:CDP-diacylglycerol--glycerol-3-phosphate 3-phosphatidyltransferase